ncbi:MAG TPA: malto-oligosyltrehalose trehalohydrolase, partial [Bacteroidales bacterium]|nr:malto-oligosyltrehalose trehalohydrolase [Bacteroidales bacterium]
IHTGTFSKEGKFAGIIPYLGELSDLGVNALEIMPVAQFSGARNWGYDGVFPYAVQNSYGGPEELAKLVDTCHTNGLAVFLDVVWNHQGPEGNYLPEFGPYFSDRYHVPWGEAINLDNEWSDGVRDFYSENAIHWMKNYHIDGLRVDAIHMMFDNGAINFWELVQSKITEEEQSWGRHFSLMAECDFNSPRIIKSVETGGYGFDAQWLDDFHHALYVLVHKEGKERYEDFGSIEQLAKAYKEGFVHSGQYVKFRKKKHGTSSAGIPGERFVVFNQNHDQIGNRVKGERLSALVGLEQLKLAAAALAMSSYIPLIFMGEEYGEDNPFYYFVSHSDEALIEAVRKGRKKEFENYKWTTEPPDPQDDKTFDDSKIDREKRHTGNYKKIFDWNKQLLSFRKSHRAMQNTDKDGIIVYTNRAPALLIHRKSSDEQEHVLCCLNFSGTETEFDLPVHTGSLKLQLSSPGQQDYITDNDLANNERKIKLEPWGVKIFSSVN